MKLAPLLLALVTQVACQFVPAPTDLTSKKGYAGINVRYKQVPHGVCELDPSVKSFTGYADVGVDQHLFFWFFEARGMDPTKAVCILFVVYLESRCHGQYLLFSSPRSF